jgi:PAS domain S-box-containing protein
LSLFAGGDSTPDKMGEATPHATCDSPPQSVLPSSFFGSGRSSPGLRRKYQRNAQKEMSLRQHALPFFAAVMTAGAILAAVIMLNRSEQAQFRERSRADALRQLSVVRARLEGALNSRLYLTRGLEAFAVTHPDGGAREFPAFAHALLAQQAGIRSVQLARNSVVSQVYPLKGNEAAVGLRLLEQPRQGEAVRQAIFSGDTVVAGPVDLVQGGVAFVSRTPVFREGPSGERSYWGLATVVIDRDALFQEAGLRPEDAGFYYALRGRDASGAHGQPFWGNEWIFLADPVTLGVSLPGGSWQIAALPENGWGAAPTPWLRVGGGLLAAVAGLLAWFLVRNPGKLRGAIVEATQALQERTGELAASERKHRVLLEHLPQRIFFKNPQSVYLSCNERYARDLGLCSAEVQGKTDFDFFPAELAHKYQADDKKVMAGGTVEEFEERYVVNGQERYVHTVKTPVHDEDGELTGILGIFWDITDRKHAEDILKHHAQIIDQIHDSVIATDLDGHITFWNQGAEAMFGYGAEECTGKHISLIYPDAHHPSMRREVIEQLREKGVYEIETWRRRKSGETIYVHLVLSLLKDRDGLVTGLVGNSMDITERMRLEREIIDVSEEEQKRIGQELHDGLGQHLTGIAFLSKGLEQKLLAREVPEARDAAEVVQLVNQAVSKTRSLARGLYPVELETNGLMSALEQLAARVKMVFGIDCAFRCGEPVLVSSGLMAINLYRIAQEAVNNAVKHGGARHIEIQLSGGHDQAELSVCDDGSGFEPSLLGRGKGMGLHIMQYRAKMIGANLDIRENSRGGATVSVFRVHQKREQQSC